MSREVFQAKLGIAIKVIFLNFWFHLNAKAEKIQEKEKFVCRLTDCYFLILGLTVHQLKKKKKKAKHDFLVGSCRIMRNGTVDYF